MHTLDIAGRTVGQNQPCFIIAEAGVNHNGDLALARRLIDAAKEAGSDAVKFQTWITEKLVTPDAPMAEYQRRNTGQEQSQFEMLKSLELSQDQFRQLKAYADTQGILFFSTPDEEESADFLEVLGVPVFKIGSAEVANLPYLRHVALKNRPIILSTGMATLGEVEAAVRTIEAAGNGQLVLLHCVSNYPAEPGDCNLRAMDTLRTAFQYPVGFSDHTLGTEIAIAAVARGACVIEKHFTLDTQLPGPDHAASLNSSDFADMVQAIRKVEGALGSGRKRPVPSEMVTRQAVRKGFVAARNIPLGKKLDVRDVVLRRTSGGLGPEYLDLLVGRETKIMIEAKQVIELEMFL